jgi:nucleoside-diphosphate-sugar epimerase
MRVVIAGGHGQVARPLERILLAAGHEPVGMVRSQAQAEHLEEDGVASVMIDLEDTSVDQMADAVRGADAVVFAAGGGADGNAARKETVDKGGAIMLADAAEQAGVRRYVMVSSMGTEKADPDSDDVFQVYLRAKKAADDDLRARDLDWTVVRPGKLTDDDPTGLVQVGTLERGEVTRGDVAATVAATLEAENTIGKTFDVLGGDTPVVEAVRAL